MVSYVGLIDEARLSAIPKKYRSHHEYCFYIHDTMVQLLIEAERYQISNVTFRFRDEHQASLFRQADNPIDFFVASGEVGTLKEIVYNQTGIALYADLLHFLHEALSALERRKFSVALSLLRKPLKESLMFSTWLFADGDDFFDRIKKSPAETMESRFLSKSKRIDLLNQAIDSINIPSMFDAELINSILFDKDFEGGLAPLFDLATHLVTSRGRLMRTEELNLNFIFRDPMNDSIYQVIYLRLSYILLYMLFLQISLFSRMQAIQQAYIEYAKLTCMGAWEGLFGVGRSPLRHSINKYLVDFLKCPHCKASITITKNIAPIFFLTEQLSCKNCGNSHHFPLYWLLSRVNFFVYDDSLDR